MLLNNIYGHKWQIEKLMEAKKKQRLPHALLFAGPEGVGKKKVAFALAESLLCEQKPSACGECVSCISIKRQNNPHVMFIQPEGLYIKVDSIRKINRFISLQSFSSARVIIIDSAHRMNLASANSFLKILEEPPSGVYFFLISSSMSALLVTIRSRTQIVRFAPLSQKNVLNIMQKTKQKKTKNLEENKWIIEMAQGSVSNMEKWQEHKDLIKQAIMLLRHINPKNPSCSLDDISNVVRNREQALLVCFCWQKVLRGLRVGGTQDYGLPLISPYLLDLFFEKAIQVEQDLKAYVDFRLLLDNFLFFCRNQLENSSS